MAEAEAIVGLRHGTTMTRAQSRTAAVSPASARFFDTHAPRARGLLLDQWIPGYHDPSTGVQLWLRTIGRREVSPYSPQGI